MIKKILSKISSIINPTFHYERQTCPVCLKKIDCCPICTSTDIDGTNCLSCGSFALYAFYCSCGNQVFINSYKYDKPNYVALSPKGNPGQVETIKSLDAYDWDDQYRLAYMRNLC